MILFFFGEDAFRIRERRLELIRAFFEKNPGSSGFFEFDFSDGASLKDLTSCLSQSGLFAAKKFVIAGNIFDAPLEVRRLLSEYLDVEGEMIARDSQRILLFFQNGEPKKNEKLWKSLSSNFVKSQAFPLLSGNELHQFLSSLITTFHGRGIEAPARALLLERCQKESNDLRGKKTVDLFRLREEARKLVAFRAGEMIREEDVRLLLPFAPEEESVFRALDLLFSGNRKEAMMVFSRLGVPGEALGLLGMCAWQLKNIIRVKGALLDGSLKNAAEAARLLGMHPFAATKCFDIASRLTLKAAEDLFLRLTRLDREAKSGVRDPDDALRAFALEESCF